MNLFLTIRVLHILLAATWFGAAVAMIFFVVPAIKEAKGAGGAVMAGVARRKYHVVMQAVAGLTVLTGFYLYYRFTNHFDPEMSASMGGRVFGTGGVAGILALVIGASVVGRTMGRSARRWPGPRRFRTVRKKPRSSPASDRCRRAPRCSENS